MKKILFLLPLLAIAVSCNTEVKPADGEYGPYTVTTIAENVYHIEDCNSSNPAGVSMKDSTYNVNNCSDMYLVVGTKTALWIDLSNKINWADNADQAISQIFTERAGKREKVITITHNHGDHTGMAYAFTEDSTVRYWLPRVDFENNKIFPAERSSFFEGGEKIDLGGGYVVSTVMVQGHTPGSMIFFVDGKNIALSGDAIGSGGGVWLFAPNSIEVYSEGVENLISYIEDPVNGIDKDQLIIWGGHYWQRANGGLELLDAQYVYDMQTLIGQIKDGNASWEPYNNARLNANFKYGTATITWNIDSARELYGQE